MSLNNNSTNSSSMTANAMMHGLNSSSFSSIRHLAGDVGSPSRHPTSSSLVGMYHYATSSSGGGGGGDGEGGAGSTGAPSNRCMTPVRLNKSAVDSAAVDVEGYYKSDPSAGGITPLIPNEIPTSTVLYVLTTSEGRDKMFKLLQYVLKLGICFLDLLPLPAESIPYWMERLGGNIQTVRNGRSMFRLGRWIITLFHIQTVVLRMLEKRAAIREEQETSNNGGQAQTECDQQQLQQRRNSSSTVSEAETNSDRSKTAAGNHAQVTWDPSVTSPDRSQLLLSANAALPVNNRRGVLDFSWLGMSLVFLRCATSISRNLIRDVLFLSTKEMFLSLPWLTPDRANTLQSVSNKSWLLVSGVDLALNTLRLANTGWVRYAKGKGVCGCSQKPSRYARNAPSRRAELQFPRLDLDFGSVVPTTAKFFEAADASTMMPSCRDCQCVVIDDAAEAAKYQDPTVHEQKLFVPWLIRQVFDFTWVVSTHENLYHTLLLQVRYLCDVFLSYRYALGDLQQYSGRAAEANDDWKGQHKHLLAAVAGATSAFVALLRVQKQAA